MTGVGGLRWVSVVAAGVLAMAVSRGVSAQRFVPNYDESKVPAYELPDPLTDSQGRPITSKDAWPARRREILEAFAREMYGRSPERPKRMWASVVEEGPAFGGRARRRQVAISLTGHPDGPKMLMLLYVPLTVRIPVPAFLGLNFAGNHATTTDPAVRLPKSWMRKGPGVQDHRATERGRGTSRSRWPYDLVLERGYALATIYYGDIDPDFDDGFQNGIHPHYLRPGQKRPAPDEWGSIGAWAWGLSRALDYLQEAKDVDGDRVAVIGHSRLGKTALWAGAQDERFALVISNNSGCGGAALSRRRFGETVARINTSFPHWFCGNFKKYNDREDELPVDQHMLIALIAPRPCYVASATEDRWADPKGEFLAVRHARAVYALLLGHPVFPFEQMPPPGKSVGKVLGYHIRQGKHDITREDWRHYLDFADRHLRRAGSGGS